MIPLLKRENFDQASMPSVRIRSAVTVCNDRYNRTLPESLIVVYIRKCALSILIPSFEMFDLAHNRSRNGVIKLLN